MTRKSINLLNMLKSVIQFYEENPRILNGNQSLKEAVEKLKVFVAEVEALEKAQAKNAKTATAIKAETKKALIQAALKVLAGIAAHAAAINDTGLKMDADITEYELKKMRDNDLITEMHEIYDLGMRLAPELKIWYVEQPDIDALDTNSAEFNAKDPAIKNIRGKSTQATADIKSKLGEAYNFIKETLDAMMKPLKITNPTLHGHYLFARTIINTAGAHSKATAPDASSTVK